MHHWICIYALITEKKQTKKTPKKHVPFSFVSCVWYALVICIRIFLMSTWFRYGLVPSHYLNQWWFIYKWTLRNKLQWNLTKNHSKISILKCCLENVSHLSQSKWCNPFNSLRPSDAYMRHQRRPSFVQIMAWCLFGAYLNQWWPKVVTHIRWIIVKWTL